MESAQAQWEFYAQGGAGCVFAALAAREPGRYGWIQKEARCEPRLIHELIEEEVEREETSMVSLVFPEVRTADQLVHLVNCLAEIPKMRVEVTPFGDFVCVGFRYLMHGAKSWVSGFGDYDFLPKDPARASDGDCPQGQAETDV